MIHTFGLTTLWTAAAMLGAAAALHVIPRCGPRGRTLCDWLARAPGLDLLITYFTVLPWFVGWFAVGWAGLLGSIAGQVIALFVWTWLHELAHLRAVRGPRIVKVLNHIVGRWRNHAALWCLTPAVPAFWLLRATQYLVYPPLTWLVKLPPHNEGEWVNVSRQKFEGLVGHDLIWCLYCDWMTGIWSLGSEMLRNIESLWCPIRFHSDKKCENCSLDFPDIRTHWIKSGGTMSEVEALLKANYPDRADQPERGADGLGGKWRPWFGGRTDLTVEGKPPDEPTPDEDAPSQEE